MKLFEIIPADFFSVLVSSNREVYVDALMKLYEMFNDDINIKLKDYLNELAALLEDRVYNVEDGDDISIDSPDTSRGKARLIEKRFEKTGWIEREFLDGSFVEIITPNTYSISVMRLLREITDEGMTVYNSLVFSTYSALNQAMAENQDRMYEAVIIAENNTEKLDYELRSLYHGIRGHLKNIRDNNDVNFLLKNHFEEYKKLSDRIYHPVKTMDSVFRYSGPIKGILMDLRYNDILLNEMTKKAITIKKYDSDEDAKYDILKTIDKIIDLYNSVALLMQEIDAKHCNYTKQSIDKIRYVMSADHSIKGKLAVLLKAYTSANETGKENIFEMLEENVSLNRQEYIDSGSFYHKNIKSKRSNQPPLAVEVHNDIGEELISEVISRIRNGFSENRVKAYIDSLFQDGAIQIDSRDIEIDNDTDYVLTLLAVVNCINGRHGYSIKLGDNYIGKNGYRIPQFVLFKEGEK